LSVLWQTIRRSSLWKPNDLVAGKLFQVVKVAVVQRLLSDAAREKVLNRGVHHLTDLDYQLPLNRSPDVLLLRVVIG
jgi:hypothetical protein